MPCQKNRYNRARTHVGEGIEWKERKKYIDLMATLKGEPSHFILGTTY